MLENDKFNALLIPFLRRKITQLSGAALMVKKIIKKALNGVQPDNLNRILKNSKKLIFKRGFSKDPRFCFEVISFTLLLFLFFSASQLSGLSFENSQTVFFNPFLDTENYKTGDLFFSQNKALAFETPDLIVKDNFIFGVSTPRILTTQTLGSFFGQDGHYDDAKDVVDYIVETGETVQSIAVSFGVSVDTLLWANDLTKNSALKIGQKLVILPVSGVSHIVKSGDTVNDISKTYKAKSEDVIAFNEIAGEIFVGDILIIPGGVMPSKSTPFVVQNLADNFFILPTEGTMTQHLHWYNAIDVANKCSTPVYAAASGVVQRAKYGWNAGGGNLVTVLHSNGVVTYYGHLMNIFVKSGERVEVGQRIGLMGTTGVSTGCHLHFGVTGAKNPLAKYFLGTALKYK